MNHLMKNFIWILLATFIFTNCANENSNNTENNQENQSAENAETSSKPMHYKADPDAPLVGLWVIEFALGSANVDKDELAAEYQGRWFSLKPDNSFVSGKWQETTNNGDWTYDAEKKIVSLNFQKVEPIGSEWRTQGQGDQNGLAGKYSK